MSEIVEAGGCPAPDVSGGPSASPASTPRGEPAYSELLRRLAELVAVLQRHASAIETQNLRITELIDLVLLAQPEQPQDQSQDETPTVGLDGLAIPRRGGARGGGDG